MSDKNKLLLFSEERKFNIEVHTKEVAVKNNGETTIENCYSYTLYNRRHVPIFTIISKVYSETFFTGLTEYFKPLFNTVEMNTLYTMLHQDYVQLAFKAFNNGLCDDFLQKHKDETFTEAMIIEFLTYYSNVNYNVDDIVKNCLQDDTRTKFYKNHLFKTELYEDKVYAYLFPAFHGYTLDEIKYFIFTEALEITHNVEFVHVLYKLMFIYVAHEKRINYPFLADKSLLVKDYNPNEAMIDRFKKERHLYHNPKFISHDYSNRDFHRIFDKNIAFTDPEYFIKFVNNLSIPDVTKIKTELFNKNNRKQFSGMNEQLQDYFTDVLNDELKTIKIDSNDGMLVSFDESYSYDMCIEEYRQPYTEKMLYIFMIDYLEEYRGDKDKTSLLFKNLHNILNYVRTNNFNCYCIKYFRKKMTSLEILNFLNELAFYTDIIPNFEQCMKYIDNYDDYKDLPLYWSLELL